MDRRERSYQTPKYNPKSITLTIETDEGDELEVGY